jgi:predicted HTH transcriptional regulator
LPAKTESPLLIDERRRLIRELVQTQGRVTVDELAERFHTSVVTIRSDLKHWPPPAPCCARTAARSPSATPRKCLSA